MLTSSIKTQGFTFIVSAKNKWYVSKITLLFKLPVIKDAVNFHFEK